MSYLNRRFLRELINNYDVISFDIFDTLLLRDFYIPTDLFKYIEDHYQITDFQKRRIAAEFECKKSRSSEEIKYADIYALIDGVDPAIELSVELQCCLANLEIKEMYELAMQLDKRIIAISDMYLDEEFVLRLLEKCGYAEIDKVYVSSAYGKRKSSGVLYDYVLEDLKLDALDILHIGDNYQSDYKLAKSRGIDAFYYTAKRDQLKSHKNALVLQKLQGLNSSEASIYSSLIAQQYTENDSDAYWHRFGFEYAGIVVYQFVEWVFNFCKDNSLKRVYFMARDGEIMKKVFDFLYAKEEIETYYLEGSRRTFFLASINELDENTLDYFTGGAPGTSIRSFIQRLELEWLTKRAEKYFNDLDAKVNDNNDRNKLKEFFKANELQLLNEAIHERKNLIAYLNNMDFFVDDNRAIVDVGWNATSQKYLEKMIGDKIYGLYFGTRKNSYWHEKVHGFYFKQGLPAQNISLIAPNIEILELVFLGMHPSIIKIDKNLNPVYFPVVTEEHERMMNAKNIHRGVLKFVKHYRAIVEKYKLKSNIKLLDVVLENFLVKPGFLDIKNIGQLSFDPGFGNSAYQKILQNLDLTYREYFMNIFRGDSAKNINYWQNGLVEYHRLKNNKYMFIINRLAWINGKIRRCRFHGFKLCAKKILAKF